jgi:hypothetical protein
MTALIRSIANPTDRAILFIAVLLILTAGLWNDFTGSFIQFGPVGGLEDNYGLNIGEILAFAALCKVIAGIGKKSILRSTDLVLLVILLIGAATPYRSLAWISATAIGLVFMIWRRDEPFLSSIGQILIACAVHELWGPKIFIAAAPFFIDIETAFAAKLLNIFSTGYSSQHNLITAQDGHTIVIFSACSAFHNLSLGALIWISIVKFHRLYFTRLDFVALAGTFAIVILINEIRIMLMARSYAYLVYWHDGPGVTIVSTAMLLSIGALVLTTSRLSAPTLPRG